MQLECNILTMQRAAKIYKSCWTSPSPLPGLLFILQAHLQLFQQCIYERYGRSAKAPAAYTHGRGVTMICFDLKSPLPIQAADAAGFMELPTNRYLHTFRSRCVTPMSVLQKNEALTTSEMLGILGGFPCGSRLGPVDTESS